MIAPVAPDSPAPPDGAAAAAPSLGEGTTAAEAGRVVISAQFSRMLAAEPGTAEGSDPEALHDMRVATRRLRAALRVFRGAYDPQLLKPLDAEVRWLAGLLGRVRDLDVLAEALAAYEAMAGGRGRPSVAWMVAEVYAQRATERLALLEALASVRYVALKHMVAQFLAASGGGPTDAAGEAPLRSRAARAIRRQLRATRRAGKRARSGASDDLHALRISAKRLRYAMEFFRDLFPADLATAIEAATAVQDHLGAMRDAQLQAERLAHLTQAAERTAEERRALRGMLRYLRRRQKREYQAYLDAYPLLASRKGRRRVKRLLRLTTSSPSAAAPGACPGAGEATDAVPGASGAEGPL